MAPAPISCELMVDPWQRDQIGVAAGDEIGQRSAGEVRGRDPVADVAAGPRLALCLVETDRAVPIPRRADRSAPAVGDLGIAERREHLTQQRRAANPAPLRGGRTPA